MRVTEPWDPLGRYFVMDIVDDLFDEGHESRVAPMTRERIAELESTFGKEGKTNG